MYLHLLIAKRERLGHCNPLFRLGPLNRMELFRQFFFPPRNFLLIWSAHLVADHARAWAQHGQSHPLLLVLLQC